MFKKEYDGFAVLSHILIMQTQYCSTNIAQY